MAFNGVAKSALKSNKQDYMNILYSDSDSDHVPDLKLPPVKGKKQRRKKTLTSLSKEEEGCGVMCVFKTILVLLICATLVILAGLCIWTLQRVSDLQEQVRELQSPDQGKPDFVLLQTQVKDIENSLKELKKSDGILEHLQSKVSDAGARLRKVEATTEKLNQSVTDAQSLLNTPKNLKSLTGVVATLGSDLKKVQETQSTNKDEFEQRLSSLEANQREKTPEMAEKKNFVDAQSRDMLSQQIADMNQTTKSGIESVENQLSLLQGRLSALETYAQSKEPGLGHDEVETLVMALIQEKMNNLTLTSVVTPSVKVTNGSSDELSEKVNRLTQIMDSKVEFAENMDLVSKGDFMFFKEDNLMKFETINRTVFALSTELDSLLHRLDAVDAAVLNISAVAANGSVYTYQNKEVFPASSISNSPSTTVSSVGGITSKTEFPAATSSGTLDQIDQELQQGAQTEGIESAEATSTGTSDEIDQELKPGLQIEGIQSSEDLHKAFLETWPKTNEQMNRDDVLSLLKNNGTESAKTLETFDTNADGRFSEEELQNALGLHDTPSPRR